jgi:glycerophosphoryl diester phosphodiesterase
MKIIGHRGARGLAAENTIASIQAALDAGVDGIEIDVRVTADDIVILCHDPHLIDKTGRKHFVETTNYSKLQSIKPDISTIAEAMDAVQGRCELLVEIKSRVKLTEVILASRVKLAHGFPIESLSFASFDFKVLKALQKEMSEATLVVNEKWSGVRATHRARKLGTTRISMNQRWLWRGFLRAMHHRGFQLSPYTVNNPRQASRWQSYLYAVITDRPDLFKL